MQLPSHRKPALHSFRAGTAQLLAGRYSFVRHTQKRNVPTNHGEVIAPRMVYQGTCSDLALYMSAKEVPNASSAGLDSPPVQATAELLW